ncbi:thioredoxin-like protein [Oleiphilus messinensis]|uniref:Fe/S biogenesis protein NfuA n=2 Tax=Oleiphilus messinensis TaxID=141451 RepID=A0A1Y0ICG1_9GAMM|nr:thioredoxin-like protein [Oleiphilus messinensis]
MDKYMVTVTEAAQTYLGDLLNKQDVEGMAVRMFVSQPGSKYAETCLAYCKPEDIVIDDEKMEFEALTIYLDSASLPYLKDAFVDFDKDRMGGQLTIKAPNAKVPNIAEDSPLSEKVNYLLVTEINPGLASHGGEVTLVEIDGATAVLRFGGGCQGCSAVSLTLKEGVEKKLKEMIPELTGVRDVTDHSVTDNAYYQ